MSYLQLLIEREGELNDKINLQQVFEYLRDNLSLHAYISVETQRLCIDIHLKNPKTGNWDELKWNTRKLSNAN